MAQKSPSCRWWSQVGGVLQKKGTYIQRTPPPMEKKKGKKKEEVPSTGIELAIFDFIVWWFHPLRHSGMKGFQFFQTKINQALAGTLH